MGKIACWFYFLIIVMGGLISGCFATKAKNKQVSQTSIKILSYNIRNAKGMDGITNYDNIAAVINRMQPDCVALQELDSATVRSNGTVVLDELARRTGMYGTYGASIDYQGGKYGIALLTREKPLAHQRVPLPGREERRSLLIVELPGYILCSTHWSLEQPDRLASVEIVNNATGKFIHKPVFLAGDLNAESGSPEIRKLSGDWLMLNDASLNTIPSTTPTTCIDYIFVRKNANFSMDVLESGVEFGIFASDHLPVWTLVKWTKN